MKSDDTLYINPLTVNSIKVLLLCNALDLQPQFKILQLHRGEHRRPEYLALNPDAKVPLLISKTRGNAENNTPLTLSESSAILQYLANREGSLLWPDNAMAQAQVIKWLSWQADQWTRLISPLAHRRVVLPAWGINATTDFGAENQQALDKVLTDMNQHLSNRTTLLGQQLSIADISLGSFLIFAEEAAIDLDDYPNIGRWLEHLSSHAWWQQTRTYLLEARTQLLKIQNTNMHIHEV